MALTKSEIEKKISHAKSEIATNSYLKENPTLLQKAKDVLAELEAELKALSGGQGGLPEEQAIINSTKLKKHQKIYLLSQMGYSNNEVAKKLGTNAGHVWNALKEYSQKPQKVAEAKSASI